MESPAFGQSTNKYKSTPKSYSQIGSSSQPYASLLALTFLEKNIKIICITIKKISLKKKRLAWQALLNVSNSRNSHFISSKVLCAVLTTERKVATMTNILNLTLLKRKIQGWNKIRQFSAVEDERMFTGVEHQSRGQKKIGKNMIEEWKENSASNILDISIQNKHLRNEIAKEQAVEESFYEKMTVLLDSVEKPKSQVSKKKK